MLVWYRTHTCVRTPRQVEREKERGSGGRERRDSLEGDFPSLSPLKKCFLFPLLLHHRQKHRLNQPSPFSPLTHFQLSFPPRLKVGKEEEKGEGSAPEKKSFFFLLLLHLLCRLYIRRWLLPLWPLNLSIPFLSPPPPLFSSALVIPEQFWGIPGKRKDKG